MMVILALTFAACSQDDEETSGPEPTTPSTTTGSVALTTVRETTGEETTVSREGTLGSNPENPDAVLRLEGDPGTRFSGICDAGGGENVLSGEVPKRFTFELNGSGLSCRIQKQDERSGSLRVILLSGSTTRSVQQTNTPEGIIEISYSSN
ncbi:MAG: hypothetical protein ACRDSJ_04625 [Rubrobacteraceae bacterium]